MLLQIFRDKAVYFSVVIIFELRIVNNFCSSCTALRDIKHAAGSLKYVEYLAIALFDELLELGTSVTWRICRRKNRHRE